jgi:hypothetical protein
MDEVIREGCDIADAFRNTSTPTRMRAGTSTSASRLPGSTISTSTCWSMVPTTPTRAASNIWRYESEAETETPRRLPRRRYHGRNLSAHLQGMSDFSPFEGKTLRGWPVATIKAGKIIARDGRIVARNLPQCRSAHERLVRSA